MDREQQTTDHFRRSSLLASGLVGRNENDEVLIVTGSPRAQSFPLPDGVDTIKLPSATKDGQGQYRARKLHCEIDDLVRVRSAVVVEAARAYQPDVVVVDHSPIGMAGEIRPLLDHYATSSERPRLVLGLRDIIDDAETVRDTWDREGIWPYIDSYDEVMVYGDTQILSTADEIGLAARGTVDVVHTGFLAPCMPDACSDEPYLLVTAGGGGDGQALVRSYFEAVEAGAVRGVRSIVITGPLMSSRRRAELTVRAEALADVEVHEFSPNMRSLIASAAGVISMAGYNTVVEELASSVPTLLVPRCHPRREQIIRAQRVAPHSSLEWVRVEELTTNRVSQFLRRCLYGARGETTLDLRGIDRAVDVLSSRLLVHV